MSRDYILIEYAGLGEGAVLSGQMCPSCHGGVRAESSLSVGRTNGLLWWRCHRNKCNFRGAHGSKQDMSATPATHAKGRWNYEIEPLPEDWLNWLSNRFRILNEVIDKEWAWTDSYGGRVVMPIRSERGIVTGYNLRTYLEPTEGDEKQGVRKALIHRVMEKINGSWYETSPYPSHIILTEDQPSALRASQWIGVNTIALLGTHINDTLLPTIRWKYDYAPTVVICLDQDATPEATRQLIALRNSYPKLRMYPLPCDIKDMDDEEFAETLTNIKEMK